MNYVIQCSNTQRTVTRTFSEDELDRFAKIFNEKRYAEQFKYDYALLDADTGEVVGTIRHLH